MSFDWKGLERRERERNSRLAVQLGLVWAGLGIVELVIALFTGYVRPVTPGVIWLAIGAVLIAVSYPRSKNRENPGNDGDLDAP